MLYEFVLDSAPNTLAENNQFFLPVLNGQITLPSNEFVVGTYSKFYKIEFIGFVHLKCTFWIASSTTLLGLNAELFIYACA